MKNDTKRWYCIRARNMNIFKPDGMVINFWLNQKNEDDVRKLVIKKGYTNVEWIKQETPPFIG